jgi:glycosyltransferase involved in cell wall biosynthesis
VLGAVAAVVAHSEHGRRQLVDVVGVDPNKVRVIHHGAFRHLTALGSAAPLPPELRGVEGPVVLFFGLLRPYKGLDVLVDAWPGVSGAELWIVGREMMDTARLRSRAPSSVRFLTRYVADAEVPALFRRADLVVLPYARTERFDQSGVLAIALAFGRPIVATAIGGLSEVAATGAVRIVPPGDAPALAGALGAVLADGPCRERMSAAALAAAAGPYSWERAAADTIALYRSLLGRA